MINPLTFIGKPLLFKNKFYIYPPTIAQVLENPFYGQLAKVLTITQEDIRDDLIQKDYFENIPTPFEFLLINAYHSENFLAIVKEAFRFFVHEEVSILFEQKKLIIGKLTEGSEQIATKEMISIEEEDYFDFQNSIRESIGIKTVGPPEPLNPNEDPRIARIKAKARERDRIKAKQSYKNGISLSTSLTAICCMGIGLTPLNIGEMSYAAIGPIMAMMQDKEKYDIDIRSLLAGADSKKIKPKYWIRNSEKE